MTDMHTHVLPQMDDGPDSYEDSFALLTALENSGVTNVVCTSHFYPDRTDVEVFLEARSERLDKVCVHLKERGSVLNLRYGAEVRLHKRLFVLEDITPLCFEGTAYVLLEFPYDLKSAQTAWDMVEEVFACFEVMPILAHIERFGAFKGRSDVLEAFKARGCLLQMDADCLLTANPFVKRYAYKLLDAGLIDLLASDCHDLHKRPPVLAQAYALLEKTRGRAFVESLQANAEALLS